MSRFRKPFALCCWRISDRIFWQTFSKVNVLVLLPCKGSTESTFSEFVLLKVPDGSSLELDALARYVDGERHLLALSVLPDRLLLDGSPAVFSRRAGWQKFSYVSTLVYLLYEVTM